ncbi:MAG TPA: hypothetical protein VE263_16875 [Candidatus Angelobacter sp.]|nr:hypothetical protein [Candidatus Angelobacter sp.]
MKQKRQVVILAALLVVAVGIWWWYLRDDKPVVTADMSNSAQNYQALNVDNPKLRTNEIEKARKTEYKGSGRNPFSPAPAPVFQPNTKPKPNVPPQPALPFVPPPPVVAPLPAKFFGFGTVPNGTIRLAFFNNGEDVFVVREGELLQNRFRILKINNVNLDYEDTTTGLRGTAALEEQAGPGSPSA